MTWNLVMQSFRLLRADKKLMLFPVLSGIGMAAMIVPFLAVMVMARGEGFHWGAPEWALSFLLYCAAAFVSVFFNCALAACVQIRFAGGAPTLGEGLRGALTRIDVIFL